MNRQIRDLSIKLSKQKARARELLKLETRSAEDQAELDALEADLESTEKELRTAMLAAEDEQPVVTVTESTEDRELRGLVDRASLGILFGNVLEHRAQEGAERELQQHFELPDNAIPLALLETRAVTPAPSDAGASQAAIVQPVFAGSVATFIGVQQPTVASGDAVYPVLTSRPAVGGPHTDSTAVAETTGAFTAEVLSPGRIQASFYWRRTDAARFRGMAESLRQALAAGLMEEFDQEIVAGAEGLLTGTNLPNNNVSAVTDFAGYVGSLGYGRVDGRYASTVGDLRIVVGSQTYAHAGATYRNASVDRTALDRLMGLTGGVRVSAHVPVAVGNKQNAVIKLGSSPGMVAPIWNGVTLIPDEVTKASTGEIQVTAVMLMAAKIIRAASYHKQQVQIA